ncbi:hypothetical protein DV517_20620 [Streptomyces sp. S816]|nr:hypothetical protein DV517_20620 [Streptomyces sp. S816]
MSPAEGDRDTQRILIVDDEPAVREALQRSLAFEGYDTEVAVDGADALEKAAAYQPDLRWRRPRRTSRTWSSWTSRCPGWTV